MSMVPQRLGKYQLRGHLGHGGMAEVWKAFDTQLERFVAIKVLRADLQNDPDFMKRFIREAQAVASLHHPNIVQVHDFQIAPPELDNTRAYMVMDYIEGLTLTDYIRNTSRIGKFPTAAEIVYLFTRICSAVDYAHQRGMIHRDIKPANILLDKVRPSRYEMGTPFLTDFGIVKLVGASTVTLSGGWIGTPLYIAPEQALGHPGNERSDIYSLGVVLYEICTGVRPFQGENIASIIMQHVTTMPTQPALINPKITPALTEVIMHALAKDPTARFSSASSMAIALTEAFNMPSSVPITSHIPAANSLNEPVYLSPPTRQLTASEALPPNIVMGDGPGGPITPLNSTTGHSFAAGENQLLPGIMPSQLPPELSSTTPSPPRKRWRGLFVALIALAILIVAGSSVGIFYLTSHRGATGTPTPVATIPVVGHAVFANSGLFNNDNSQGVEDELQISLQNIPHPAPGKSYYAWLLSDTTQKSATSLFLGKLSLVQRSVQILYPGDAQHSNLLATYSRFLITEEDANTTPTTPSSDRHTWRYYAELPQMTNSSDQFNNSISMLNYLRILLFNNGATPSSITAGGVATWLLRNTQRALDEANNAMNAWNGRKPAALRSHLANLLAYIDGASYLKQDLPTAVSSVTVEANLYQMGLIAFSTASTQTYEGETHYNLMQIAIVPAIPPDKSKLANQTDEALPNVVSWLQMAHDDAITLFPMTNAQLLSRTAQSTLQDMVSQVSYAYNGQTTGKTQQEGVEQIYPAILKLATFDVQPYS